MSVKHCQHPHPPPHPLFSQEGSEGLDQWSLLLVGPSVYIIDCESLQRHGCSTSTSTLFIFPLWQAEPSGVEWSTAEVQRACTLPEGVITCFTSPPLTPTLIPSKPIISVPNIMGCGAKFPAPVTSPNRISVLRIFLSDAHRRGKCAIFTSPHDSGHVSGERKNGINLGYITHLISDIKKQP